MNCYQGCAEKCTYTRFMPRALASIQISEVCVIQAETAYIKSPPPPRPPSHPYLPYCFKKEAPMQTSRSKIQSSTHCNKTSIKTGLVQYTYHIATTPRRSIKQFFTNSADVVKNFSFEIYNWGFFPSSTNVGVAVQPSQCAYGSNQVSTARFGPKETCAC